MLTQCPLLTQRERVGSLITNLLSGGTDVLSKAPDSGLRRRFSVDPQFRQKSRGGKVGSNTLRAPSLPTTGRSVGSISPICTSTLA